MVDDLSTNPLEEMSPEQRQDMEWVEQQMAKMPESVRASVSFVIGKKKGDFPPEEIRAIEKRYLDLGIYMRVIYLCHPVEAMGEDAFAHLIKSKVMN